MRLELDAGDTCIQLWEKMDAKSIASPEWPIFTVLKPGPFQAHCRSCL